jgi:hypothetical protein
MRFQRNVFGAAVVALLVGAAARPAAAQFFTNSTGLPSPNTTITFSEVVVAHGTLVTNQFAGFGATFTNLVMTPLPFSNNNEPNITFPDLANFVDRNTPLGPVTVTFNTSQTAAAFALIANAQPTFFDALLGGSVVASGSAPTETFVGKYVGFTGITFDAIRFAPAGGFARIDNLQIGTSALSVVPEPPSAAAFLACTGALAIGIACRRRSVSRPIIRAK